MEANYRCRSCGAYFEGEYQRCPVCSVRSERTARDTCRRCGTPLVDAADQRCPLCGSGAVETVAVGRPE